MYKFQKLTVWQEAMKLALQCYKLAALLPKLETYALADQLRRAVISISLNIAEGSGADTDKEFCRYLLLARKSLYEVVNILLLVQKLYPDIKLNNAFADCDNIGRLLNGLINKLKSDS